MGKLWEQWKQIRGNAKWDLITNSYIWGFVGYGITTMWTWFSSLPGPAIFCLSIGVAAFSVVLANEIQEWRRRNRNEQEQNELAPPQSPKLSRAAIFLLLTLGVISFGLYHHGNQSTTDSLNSSVSQNSHFAIRLDKFYFVRAGNFTNLRSSGTALVVVVSVRNRGAPSAAEEWKLTIQVGKREYTGQSIPFPDTFFVYHDQSECIHFYGKDNLTHKTAVLIPSNDIPRGILIYDFPDVSQEELMREHAVIRLECKDFDRKTSQGSFPISDVKFSNEKPVGITTEIGRCSNLPSLPHSKETEQ